VLHNHARLVAISTIISTVVSSSTYVLEIDVTDACCVLGAFLAGKVHAASDTDCATVTIACFACSHQEVRTITNTPHRRDTISFSLCNSCTANIGELFKCIAYRVSQKSGLTLSGIYYITVFQKPTPF